MAYAAITNPGQFFNTVLYTGTDASIDVTGVGFQPDLVWIKCRSHGNNTAFNHNLNNSLAGVNKNLYPNDASQELSNNSDGRVSAFGTDGFTATAGDGTSGVGRTYVAWNWKTGTTGSGSTTGSGTSKSYTYSVNTDAGISIMRYEGNSTSGHTVPHHLGVAPQVVFNKETGGSSWWFTFVSAMGDNSKVLFLNDTSAQSTQAASYNSTAPSSTVVTYGNDHDLNNNGQYYQAICFAEKKGYSKFGKFTGNGQADGTFVYTGFKPAFVMIKRYDGTENWAMFDSTRDTHNVNHKLLYGDQNYAEYTGVSARNDFLSNGFKLRLNDNKENGSGLSYVYFAFAKNPLVANVGDDGVPATAR